MNNLLDQVTKDLTAACDWAISVGYKINNTPVFIKPGECCVWGAYIAQQHNILDGDYKPPETYTNEITSLYPELSDYSVWRIIAGFDGLPKRSTDDEWHNLGRNLRRYLHAT